MLLVGFKNPALKHLTGKTLAEVASRRGTSPEETAMDLVIEDDSRVDTVYFMMYEEDVQQERRPAVGQLRLRRRSRSRPRARFCSSQPHPRTYGNFARLLGKYVRDEKVDSAGRGDSQAERAAGRESGPRATAALLEAGLLRRRRRLRSRPRFRTTPRSPSRTNTRPACVHVLVNGTQVLADGEHTGAKPGRAVWGRGRKTK